MKKCIRILPAPLPKFLIFLFFLVLLAGCSIKPEPFTRDDLAIRAKGDLEKLFGDQEAVPPKIDLYQAMAWAIKYNLEQKIKMIEKSIARTDLTLAEVAMLPRLTVSAGYSELSDQQATYEKTLTDAGVSLGLTVDQDHRRFTYEIVHVWNLLDFGVSYYTARQEADNILIVEEWRRKAVQNIVQDVRNIYWRTVSAAILLPEIDALLKDVQIALEQSRERERLNIGGWTENLASQEELLEIIKEMREVQRHLATTKTELAAFMNVSPGAEFTLAPYPREKEKYFHALEVASLEQEALVKRPELLAEAYQQRQNALEVKKSLVRMLPGLEISLAPKYDDNKYLYHNNWTQAGLNLSWNIFNMLSGPDRIDRAKATEEISKQRSLALSMMILTQVNLAAQRYQLALKDLEICDQLASVHRRRSTHENLVREEGDHNGSLEMLQFRAKDITAQMERGWAYADLQSSLGRLYHSIGFDPFPQLEKETSLEQLAKLLELTEKRQRIFLDSRGNGEVVAVIGAGISPRPGMPEPLTKSEDSQPVVGEPAPQPQVTQAAAVDLAEDEKIKAPLETRTIRLISPQRQPSQLIPQAEIIVDDSSFRSSAGSPQYPRAIMHKGVVLKVQN